MLPCCESASLCTLSEVFFLLLLLMNSRNRVFYNLAAIIASLCCRKAAHRTETHDWQSEEPMGSWLPLTHPTLLSSADATGEEDVSFCFLSRLSRVYNMILPLSFLSALVLRMIFFLSPAWSAFWSVWLSDLSLHVLSGCVVMFVFVALHVAAYRDFKWHSTQSLPAIEHSKHLAAVADFVSKFNVNTKLTSAAETRNVSTLE